MTGRPPSGRPPPAGAHDPTRLEPPPSDEATLVQATPGLSPAGLHPPRAATDPTRLEPPPSDEATLVQATPGLPPAGLHPPRAATDPTRLEPPPSDEATLVQATPGTATAGPLVSSFPPTGRLAPLAGGPADARTRTPPGGAPLPADNEATLLTPRPPTGRVAPHTGRVAPHTGRVAPHTGRVAPHTGRVAPHTGRVAPHTGRVAPHTGRVAPHTGRVAPHAGRVAPHTGPQPLAGQAAAGGLPPGSGLRPSAASAGPLPPAPRPPLPAGPSPSAPGGDAFAAPPGTVVAHFEVVRTLGRGGMGVVYLARDLQVARQVALKVLPMTAATSETSVLRFKREADAAAALEHPGILPVYGWGRDDTQRVFWLAMAYVPGRSYDAVLRAEGKESIPRAVRVVRDAARALQHAHERGVVHRDVKPSNLMLAGPKVYLVDFGLARHEASQELTVEGQVMGTLRYMSPEQALGDRAEAASDIYSLGATLFVALTGAGPYAGVQRIENLQLRFSRGEPVRSPRSLRPELPRDLEAIVLAALELEPARRYPSAAALAADLDRFLAGEPVRAQPPSTGRRIRRWARRHRAGLAIAGILAAAVLAIPLTASLAGTHEAVTRGARLLERTRACDPQGAPRAALLDLRQAARAFATDAQAQAAAPAEAEALAAAGERLDAAILARTQVARAELEQAWQAAEPPAARLEELAAELTAWAEAARPVAPEDPTVLTAARLAARTPSLARNEAQEVALPFVPGLHFQCVGPDGRVQELRGKRARVPARGVIRAAGPGYVAAARVYGPRDLLAGDELPRPHALRDRNGVQRDLLLVQAPGCPAFLLARTEVTRGAFRRFVAEGYGLAASWEGEPEDLAWWRREGQRRQARWRAELADDDPGRASLALVGLTFPEARAFARRQRRRLPRDAEWNAAAALTLRPPLPPSRAGRADAPHPADDAGPCQDIGPLGLLNMAGNATEWTAEGHCRGGSYVQGLLLEERPAAGSDAGLRCAKDLPKGAVR